MHDWDLLSTSLTHAPGFGKSCRRKIRGSGDCQTAPSLPSETRNGNLAELYGVDTGALNRAVKRNAARFPDDFMFQLTREEAGDLKCQFGISSSGHGGRRRSLPYAFTEQGVAMLSSVLRSERAVLVNIAILRAFVGLRRLLATNEVLARKLAALERRLEDHDQAIRSLFDAIRELAAPPAKPRREIGFHVKEDRVPYRAKRK